MIGKNEYNIGDNLRKLREECGYSLEHVVSAMKDLGYNWNRTTLFNIEHNMRRLQLQEACDLINCLGLDPLKDLYLLCSGPEYQPAAEAFKILRSLMDKLNDSLNEYTMFDKTHAAIIHREMTFGRLSREEAGLLLSQARMMYETFAQRVNDRRDDETTDENADGPSIDPRGPEKNLLAHSLDR